MVKDALSKYLITSGDRTSEKKIENAGGERLKNQKTKVTKFQSVSGYDLVHIELSI